MQYHWNWSILVAQPYVGWLLDGVTWTLLVAGAAWIIALAIGCTIGVLSTLPGRTARLVATAYVDVFRNIPLLLQLFLWYFVLPELLPGAFGLWIKRDMPMPEYWFSVAGIGCFTAARTPKGRLIDSVARFHLGNGARLERINWLGDLSPKGIRE
ncbi:MAG: ABC transporter permease subunit, partial [Bradyrhizobium sp.]